MVDRNQPRVSIIVPAYNCENYIKQCVDSLLAQTYSNVEIIVVNDGSTDNTWELLSEYSDRVRLENQDNMGVCAARNKGLEMSTGDYLIFVDSDDFVRPDYIEKMAGAAVQNDSELVLSGYMLTDAEGRVTDNIIPGKYLSGEDEIWAYRLSSVCSRLYRKEYWVENRLTFVEEKGARGEDIPIAIYANATAKNIQILDYAGYYYRQHSSSAMNTVTRAGGTFLFPYEAMEGLRKRMEEREFVNGRDFYVIGWVKAMAHFEYVLYRNADREEKKRYGEYVSRVLRESFPDAVSIWKRYWLHISLPLRHRVAMWMLLRKYTKYAG